MPQYHSLDPKFAQEVEPQELEKVARSQFRIAQFIETHSQVPVFSEQATRDSNWTDLSVEIQARLLSNMDFLLPSGLPSRFEDLDSQQKAMLIKEGGEGLQFFRGKVSTIHRTIENEEIHRKLFAPILEWFRKNPGSMQSYSPKIRSIVYNQRERLALEQIKRYVEVNPNVPSVILIYGAGHNFNFYPDLFDRNCIEVPSEFQKTWLGKRRSE